VQQNEFLICPRGLQRFERNRTRLTGLHRSNLLGAVSVAAGSLTAAQSTIFSSIVFALLFIGAVLDDVGGKAYDARATSDANPLNSS